MSDLRVLERINLSDNDPSKLREVLDPPSAKKEPQTDFRGRISVSNQMSRVFDDTFPIGDPRRKIATLHRHLTADGKLCFGGKLDPKRITTPDGTIHSLMTHDGTCDLCQSGDMISPWKRFLFSRYCPGTRARHVYWKLAKRTFGRLRGMMRI